jgi:amino acid transporter
LFYIVSLTIIGCLVPYTHPRLGVKNNSADANASPFVLAVLDAQIPFIPHIINGAILLSVLSVGNASTFAASRTLEALAEIGQAPKIFAYVDKKGRPLVTLALILAFGPLAFIGAYDGGAMFDWLFALCGLSSFFTWYSTFEVVNVRGSLCFAHIRFRSAIKAQAHRGELKLEDLPYRAILGVYGSWIGFILCCLCIVATIYKATSPGGTFTVVGFFQEILALPIVVFCYVLWKLWKRDAIVKVGEADLVSGRREMDLHHEKQRDLNERATWGPIKRYVPFDNIDCSVYRKFC